MISPQPNIEDVSLLVITNRNTEFLERSLRYHSGMGLPIFIADSSKDEFESELLSPPQIRYSWFPPDEHDFCLKVALALEDVPTSFTVILPDDDFLVTNGLHAAVDRMSFDPLAAVAQGAFWNLYEGRRPRVISVTSNRGCSGSPSKRLKHSYGSFLYGVNRTENLKTFFSVVNESQISKLGVAASGFIDDAYRWFLAARGDLHVVEKPFLIRSVNPATDHSKYERERLIFEASVLKFLDNLVVAATSDNFNEEFGSGSASHFRLKVMECARVGLAAQLVYQKESQSQMRNRDRIPKPLNQFLRNVRKELRFFAQFFGSEKEGVRNFLASNDWNKFRALQESST